MIARLILWSGRNRLLILLATSLICAWGIYSAIRTPIDAIPDLSDTQVIIRTSWPDSHRRSSKTKSPIPSPQQCSPYRA